MNCSQCGVEINSQSNVCPACGTGVPASGAGFRIGRWRISRMAAASCLVLALLMFLMPWVNLTCAGETVETVSGVDLLVGVDYGSSTSSYNSNPYGSYYSNPYSSYDGKTESTREGPEVLVILAFAAGAIGVALFLVNSRAGSIGRGAMGILGMVFLLGLVIKIHSDLGDTEGVVAAEYQAGFYLTFLCFLGAAIASFLPFWNGIFESPGPAERHMDAGQAEPLAPPSDPAVLAEANREQASQDSAITAAGE